MVFTEGKGRIEVEEDRVEEADSPPPPLASRDGGKSHGSRTAHAPVRIVYI